MMNGKEMHQLVSAEIISFEYFSSIVFIYISIYLLNVCFCILDDINESPRANHSIFSIEFYQKFFDVDAGIVKERILSAIVPRRAPVHYMKQDIGPNPDLYGPFWIVVTLVRNIEMIYENIAIRVVFLRENRIFYMNLFNPSFGLC